LLPGTIKRLESRVAGAHSLDMSEPYEADILDWSEQQAALLRRVAAGERVNGVDWPDIAEEIESVGRDQLHTVESLLVQAMLRMLKAEAWALSRAAPGWQAEARLFRLQARRRFALSMLQRLHVPGLYADAVRAMPDTIDGEPPLPVPAGCPVTLDELLAEA
jgi:Domain of unknown function DUF29